MLATNEIDKEGLQPLAEIDRVIHEPARLLILAYLSVVESADFLFLMNQTALTRGNLSSHLSKLEAAGYQGFYVAEYIEGFNDVDPLVESRRFLEWIRGL